METANKKKRDSFYPLGLSDRQGGDVAVFIKDACKIDVDLAWGGSDSSICMDGGRSLRWCSWHVDFILDCARKHGV
jgi:hypothetical protein